MTEEWPYKPSQRKVSTTVAIVTVVLAAVGFWLALPWLTANASEGGGHDPVTICHKPGTPAEHTIVVDDDAVEAHLAHGDYLGECQGEPEPELVAYKVVAGMPRYRGDVFYDEPGLTCKLAVNMARRTWTAYCGDHVDKGRINARYRTFVRLRQVGEPGPAAILLDLR